MKQLAALIPFLLLTIYSASYAQGDQFVTTTRVNIRTCPDPQSCSVIDTLSADTKLQVIGRNGEWLNVQVPALGYTGWVNSQHTAAVIPTPATEASRSEMPTGMTLLLLSLPLFIGLGVWLIKPAPALSWIESCNRWILRRQEKARMSSSTMARYWAKPVFWSAGLLIKGTEKIKDPYLRCGTRTAAYLYFAGAVVVATLTAAYVVITVVLMILMLILMLWIAAKLFSSSGSPSYSGSRSSEGEWFSNLFKGRTQSTPRQGWLESDRGYQERVYLEGKERLIEETTGAAPRQGWLESEQDYRRRLAHEANERVVEAATGSLPKQGWLESDADYRDRIAKESNERVIEGATGAHPRQGWLESDDDYRRRIAYESNERIVGEATGTEPRQGFFESNEDYRSRVSREASELRASRKE